MNKDLGYDGAPMLEQLLTPMIADRIRDYALQAEVKASVHTFRHCCATHLLRGQRWLRT